MSACPQFAPLLLDEVAGDLSPADGARLDAHRRGCAACREEGATLGEVLSLVRLPPVDEAERRALDGLAASVARGLGVRSATRTGLKVGGAIAAAAAALLLLVPATRPSAGAARRGATPAAAAAPAWQPPDPDALWSAADLFEDDDTSASATDAAVASLGD